MSGFDLKILTLDGVVYDGLAESVVARITAGDVCILKNHIDYIGTIEIGKVKVKTKEEIKEAACAGGFLSVSGNKVRIVATTFEFADEIDSSRALKAKEKAEKKLEEAKLSKNEEKLAEIKLKKALLRLEVSSRKEK